MGRTRQPLPCGLETISCRVHWWWGLAEGPYGFYDVVFASDGPREDLPGLIVAEVTEHRPSLRRSSRSLAWGEQGGRNNNPGESFELH